MDNPKTEVRLVRHDFTQQERLQLGSELAQNHRQLQGIEAEFEGVKANFKARIAEAESRFERRAEIVLFKDGLLVVGRLKGKWYAALRVRIGHQKIEERLAPDWDKFKNRPDAIKATVTRLEKWVTQQFGAETWKGFADAVAKVVKTHESLEE